MTVSSTESRKSYAGNGVTTSFDTNPVVFFDAADLTVYVVTTATGVVDATLTNGTHYSTNGGDGATGTVNLAGGSSPYGAPAVGKTLLIVRELDITQGSDLVNNDNSDAEVVEDALDRLTMIAQELNTAIERSFKLPDSDVSGASTAIPTPAASTLIGWNSTGTALQNYSTSTLDLALTTPYTLTLLDDVDAAAARATLGLHEGLSTGSIFDAKGDLISASADNTPARLAVGAEGAALVADPAQATGLRYVTLGAGAVRQSVLSAALDANGYNAAITTGSGLRPGLDASPTPMVLAFAAGFGALGSHDLVSTLSADVADIVGANLPASNTSFLHATHASLTSVTWGSSLVPPQYGYAFDRTKGALLNFNGTDASTTILDDFGNTWTAAGNAQLDTAQAKFGASSGLLDGTGDYFQTTDITSLGDGAWEAKVWVRFNALPGAGTRSQIWLATNNAGFGAQLTLFNNAGTTRAELFLSSNGTAADIANGLTGTNTAWSTGTWYRFRVVHDPLGATYRLYLSVNGAAETQQISVASSGLRVNGGLTMMRLGSNTGASEFLNGWVDAFSFLPCATSTSTETPSASAPSITDYPVHFFSIPEMKMYEVTGASSGAGVNPTMTARNRVFVAEADTGGASVSAVRNYALRGEYISPEAALPAINSATSHSHNIGTYYIDTMMMLVNQTAGSAHKPGNAVNGFSYHTNGTSEWESHPVVLDGRCSLKIVAGVGGFIAMSADGSSGVFSAGGGTAWRYRVRAKRAF